MPNIALHSTPPLRGGSLATLGAADAAAVCIQGVTGMNRGSVSMILLWVFVIFSSCSRAALQEVYWKRVASPLLALKETNTG